MDFATMEALERRMHDLAKAKGWRYTTDGSTPGAVPTKPGSKYPFKVRIKTQHVSAAEEARMATHARDLRRRAPEDPSATERGPAAHPAHRHLAQAEEALRASGHHEHADAVAKVRKRMGAEGEKPAEAKKTGGADLNQSPLKMLRDMGAEGMADALRGESREDLLKFAGTTPIPARVKRGPVEGIVSAIVDAARFRLSEREQ